MTALAAALLSYAAPTALANCADPTGTEDVRYCYDTLGRLTEARYADGRKTMYTYDAAGNRTNVSVTGGSSSTNGTRVVVVPIGGFTIIPLPPS